MVLTSEPGGSDISEALISTSYHSAGPGGSDIIEALLSTSVRTAGP